MQRGQDSLSRGLSRLRNGRKKVTVQVQATNGDYSRWSLESGLLYVQVRVPWGVKKTVTKTGKMSGMRPRWEDIERRKGRLDRSS